MRGGEILDGRCAARNCYFRKFDAGGDGRDKPGHDGVAQPKRQSFGRLVVRRETDKEQEVQVLYGEDLASHAGPAPCVVFHEGQGEASAGVRAGWPLSRVRPLSRVPTGLPTWKATRPAALPRAVGRPGAVRDPSMHGRFLFGNREISSLASGASRWSAPGR